MDNNHNDITNHEKNKHLTYEERMLIEIRRKDGWSPDRIAKELGCVPNTIRNELRRGNIGTEEEPCYQAKAGQQAYDEHRRTSRNCFQAIEKKRLLNMLKRMSKRTDGRWTPVQIGLFRTGRFPGKKRFAPKHCTTMWTEDF